MLSPDSVEFLEEHLKTCPACRAEREKLAAEPLPPEEKTETAPELESVRRKLRRQRRRTAALAVCLALALAAALFARLTERHYFPEPKGVVSAVSQPGSGERILRFTGGVTGAAVSYQRAEGGGSVVFLSVWWTEWDRLFGNTLSEMPAPAGSTVYFSPNNGTDDILLWGQDQAPGGGVISLPRLALAYYAALALAALAVLGWLWHSLPAEILLEPGQTLTLPRFAYVQPLRTAGSRNAASTQAAGSYQATLSIGGWLPVKTVRALVETRPVVTVCGTPFGVKMFSEGALIVGFSDLNTPDGTANPAKKAGLRLGDRVVRMDDTLTETNDAVHDALETAAGAPVQVVYIRNGEQFQTRLTPVWDSTAGQWRAGMWVRDSSAGVGTMTFVDNAAGVFAGLGHPISDSDTGESVALRSGEIVPCQIVGCTSGTVGSPGELKGRFLSTHALGSICINSKTGVYGRTRAAFSGPELEMAFAQEVVPGDAEIWTTVDGEVPKAYRIRIEKVNDADPHRNMILRVTDRQLLAKTGGIVQGMSGSPILQNGRLVGAVTHVLVNDPTRGYGIFAQTMLKQARAVEKTDDTAHTQTQNAK